MITKWLQKITVGGGGSQNKWTTIAVENDDHHKKTTMRGITNPKTSSLVPQDQKINTSPWNCIDRNHYHCLLLLKAM